MKIYNYIKDSFEMFAKLGLKGTGYFNAGVMFINYKKWLANNSKQGLLLKMHEIQNKIIFWDQDVLNAYFNGEYLEINDSYNYKVDVDDPKQGKIDIENIKILHYVGKSKPWIIASFHPAFLMRQPEQKKLAWIDLKMIRKKLDNLNI